jgi:hypothetical protein
MHVARLEHLRALHRQMALVRSLRDELARAGVSSVQRASIEAQLREESARLRRLSLHGWRTRSPSRAP